MSDLTENWDNVKSALEEADSIAFDGCHKIYVLMDAGQTEQMASFGYNENSRPGGSRLYTKKELTAGEMLEKLQAWFDNSCGLRFINKVSTVEGNNENFEHLIAQFEADDDEDEEDE